MHERLISELRFSGNEFKDLLRMGHICEIMLQAADAIEELQKALDAVNDAHNEGYDVRPLVRGKWERKRYGPWASRLKCSECEMLFDIATDSPSWNFCPNCGAKMEES